MKDTPARPPRNDFGRVLADIRQADGLRGEEYSGANFNNPAAASAFLVISDEAPARGGASYWNDALAWIAEQDDFAAGAAAEDLLDRQSVEEIADELRLDEVRTREDLNAVRRLFMWRNHPDRQGETRRRDATRRVAIANMLIDRAHARLAERSDQA